MTVEDALPGTTVLVGSALITEAFLEFCLPLGLSFTIPNVCPRFVFSFLLSVLVCPV